MVSVLILTKNEQQDLPGCLHSVSWSDDVHVFDSYSTDDTVEIAIQAGASIIRREFDNWSDHQNWGLRNIPFKYPWVLYIDADERVTPQLHHEVLKAAASKENNVAFLIQRRDFFLGRWLKHVQATSQYMRLFRPEKMSYQRLVNPISIPDGPVGRLGGYLDHYPFSKGIGPWLTRHNAYSTFEAQQIVENLRQKATFSIRKAFISPSRSERRFHQKEIFYRLPARPLIKFLLLYLGKQGFLDGRAGLTYAALQSIYEYMIVLKTRELKATSTPSAPPNAARIIP